MADSLLEDQTEENTDYYEMLVGEGKKYADNQALAKSRVHADSMIETLKTELAELRAERQATESLEEVADRALKPRKELEEMSTTPRQDLEPEPQNEDKPDLRTEVLRLLQEEKSRETRDQNIETVRRQLKERFGSDYNKTLKEIAETLEVSTDLLTDMAARSPNGLLKLVDSVAKPSVDRPSTPPASSVDTNRGFGSTPRKNKAYYAELRKTDLNKYLSKAVQAEMHREAVAQGAKFYE